MAVPPPSLTVKVPTFCKMAVGFAPETDWITLAEAALVSVIAPLLTKVPPDAARKLTTGLEVRLRVVPPATEITSLL